MIINGTTICDYCLADIPNAKNEKRCYCNQTCKQAEYRLMKKVPTGITAEHRNCMRYWLAGFKPNEVHKLLGIVDYQELRLRMETVRILNENDFTTCLGRAVAERWITPEELQILRKIREWAIIWKPQGSLTPQVNR